MTANKFFVLAPPPYIFVTNVDSDSDQLEEARLLHIQSKGNAVPAEVISPKQVLFVDDDDEDDDCPEWSPM